MVTWWWIIELTGLGLHLMLLKSLTRKLKRVVGVLQTDPIYCVKPVEQRNLGFRLMSEFYVIHLLKNGRSHTTAQKLLVRASQLSGQAAIEIREGHSRAETGMRPGIVASVIEKQDFHPIRSLGWFHGAVFHRGFSQLESWPDGLHEDWLYLDRYKTRANSSDLNDSFKHQKKNLKAAESTLDEVDNEGDDEKEDAEEGEDKVGLNEDKEIDEDDPDYDNNYFDNGEDDEGMGSGGKGGDEGGVF
ncbi:hypothetical protein BY996DRAFT_6546811 [Phakopsora pachyrhizi]|nr:hypothetical protein BY996DRAFT_6546811 [Phakopsora pachyrhizi]